MTQPGDTADRLDTEATAARALLDGLRRDFTGIVDASANSNADDEHDPEGSTIAFERSQVTAMIDQAERRLREIAAARARLDAGTYGLCEVCGEPIAAARLEARPTARTCVACS
ncbi:TraR/DksA family transcriptional regulator [Aeromicrobium wangtongii]|uniref:TraR/DksA C4-type zinc finger protein n=1 Tax=Aeromicrobium wangtongii TaxID=2969247 RepID=A0ABY5MDC8_9ACTN|nr:TraR/DksA C4-type zinc finger protein [Aeromicrobium wangtongii]MCD9197187.1 TraR/DksA C4-type zinc finger protein [Aeromicrobium wangtongii]UUP14683.1 TraR/DksA C4-type zinc finger protein [Aeromicrobium wangtongii]